MQGWGELGVGDGVEDRAGTGTGAVLYGMVTSPLPKRGPLPGPLGNQTAILSCPGPAPAPRSRFDAGSGMATIRHPTPLALGQFHTVTLLRSLTQGSLIVGSLAPVNGTSQVRPPPLPSPCPWPCPTSPPARPPRLTFPLPRASSRAWT